MSVAGGKLYDRFQALSGDSTTDESAYGSYQDRMFLMERALYGVEHHPLFGLGVNNFITYSTIWHEVHMTYLQIAVEGGIPCLILYLLFFRNGFRNLKVLRRTPNLDQHTVLFVGALHSSLIGFVVGAMFAPEAYQFFPYFAVAFTATLLQTVKEREWSPVPRWSHPRGNRGISWRSMPITEEQTQSALAGDVQAILNCLGCGGKLEATRRAASPVPLASARIRT